jgi:hypothetical protein
MFFKKKKKPEASNLPELKPIPTRPDLPKAPEAESKKEFEFPAYESEFGDIKKEVGRPVFKPKKEEPKIFEIPKREKIKSSFLTRPSPEPVEGEEKPIFVKIDQYKNAIKDIDLIKEKCREADHIMDEIKRIRNEEDRELEDWHRSIERIKNKLLDIDKKLFEI